MPWAIFFDYFARRRRFFDYFARCRRFFDYFERSARRFFKNILRAAGDFFDYFARHRLHFLTILSMGAQKFFLQFPRIKIAFRFRDNAAPSVALRATSVAPSKRGHRLSAAVTNVNSIRV